MTPTVFISYSRDDETWMNRLKKQLDVLGKEGYMNVFADTSAIKTGDTWPEEIDKGLKNAAAAIFMVSPGFLTSDFCKDVEVKALLKRREKGEVKVFPVIVSPCQWKIFPWLKELQVLNGKEGQQLSIIGETKADVYLSKLAGDIYEYFDTVSIAAARTAAEEGDGTCLLTDLPKRSEYFTGRDSVLQDLDRLMEKKEPVVLINGMGGIGKTEVCRQWFRDHYLEFPYAGWVDYVDSFRQSLFTSVKLPVPVSDSQTMDERYAAIISFLRTKPGQVLLVVDNIEDPDDEDLGDLLRLPVSVLASSRQTVDGFTPRDLDQLNMESCKRLFYRYYGQTENEKPDPDVEAVIELCGYHTLTVELLARTARNAAQPIKWLRDKLKDHGIQLDPSHSTKTRTRWQDKKEKKALKEHLGVVFDLSRLDENELNILINLSILPSMDLAVNDIRQWLDLPSNDPINALIEKGWLKRKGIFIFMHQVIADVVRQKHPPDIKNCGQLVDSLTDLLSVEPTENPIDKKEFVVLGESVVTRLESYQDEALATLANNLSARYKDLGQLEKALEFQKKASDIYEAVLDKNHPSLATSYNNLSLIYQDLGQLEKALEFQKKASEIYEAVLDKNHPSLATSYNNLSQIYQDLGQLEKALEFQKKTVQIFEEILDKNHPSLATSYNNLSLIYKDLGQLEKALEFQKKAIEIVEVTLDKNHPSLATAYHNLSRIYLALKNYPAALDYSRRAVAILETLFPNGHYNLDIMKDNLEEIKIMMIDE